MASQTEIDEVMMMVQRAHALANSEDVMVARAATRVAVVLTELLIDIAPRQVVGPWQLWPEASR